MARPFAISTDGTQHMLYVVLLEGAMEHLAAINLRFAIFEYRYYIDAQKIATIIAQEAVRLQGFWDEAVKLKHAAALISADKVYHFIYTQMLHRYYDKDHPIDTQTIAWITKIVVLQQFPI